MKKNLALMLAMLFIATVFTACAPSTTTPGTTTPGTTTPGTTTPSGGGAVNTSKRDDVVIYCENPWATLDPYGTGCTTYVNMYLSNQMYEALVYVSDTSEIIPVLATEWKASADGLVYTFTLRDGVKFHNGETMKASDVVYSFNRAMSEAPLDTYYSPIDKVEAVDDLHVDITLKYSFGPFVSYMEYIPIVSEKYATANSLLDSECGTGPYQLVSFDMNTECKMTRFDEYWKGPASIKDVTFKVIFEATSAIVAFESGDIDFAFCFNVSAYAPLADSGKYNTKLGATLHTAYILLNNKVAPLDNKLVRQALALATDRETMITIAYEGLAQPAYLLANTSCFGVSEENFTNHYPYDLEKAKAKLAEAGYPNGLDLGNMTIMGGTYHEKYAQVWQQSLSQIGVKIELVSSESAVADCTAHNYTTATMGGGFMSDFAYTASYYTPDNMSNYENAEVTAMYEEAAGATDPAKRLELYDKIGKIIQDEVPNIPIFNKQIAWVWNKDLNAEPHFNSGHPYYVYEMSWK